MAAGGFLPPGPVDARRATPLHYSPRRRCGVVSFRRSAIGRNVLLVVEPMAVQFEQDERQANRNKLGAGHDGAKPLADDGWGFTTTVVEVLGGPRGGLVMPTRAILSDPRELYHHQHQERARGDAPVALGWMRHRTRQWEGHE